MATIKVSMFPHIDDLQPDPIAGISRVVKNYFELLPNHGIEMLPKDSTEADLVAIHAGSLSSFPEHIPIVSHCHGLYFTADKDMGIWTHGINQVVIEVVRHAATVTVPSEWVAQVFRRDMHFNPIVIPHAVEWDEWQGGEDLDYVLWNKNRASDACDPSPVNELAMRAPKTRFLTTYAAPNPRPNIRVTGTMDYASMKDMILKCSVYLATTKETFGIGTLEAMAAGKPILGFDYGGTADLVKHGYTGYLARPGDYDDLAQGLEYCRKHAKVLGSNAALVAKHYSWDKVAEMVARQYALTVGVYEARTTSVAVVIPMYNKAATVRRAIMSAVRQSRKPRRIVVVNNNSTDDFAAEISIAETEASDVGIDFLFVNCPDQGVAHARNYGIGVCDEDFIVCLDADDEISPDFIDVCRAYMISDRSLGITYAGIEVINQEGQASISQWPSEYKFDQTLKGKNQVPTCCLFKREAWERAGGYRQRYAPDGAGSEDADLWLRIGLLGYGGLQATKKPLFRYYLGGAVSGNPNYHEKDWRGDKGYIATNELPFAATATPANHQSHLVRQYDEPLVSVIIPVGPGHIDTVIDAIDSVEGQTFRQWELIVVADGDSATREEADKWNRLRDAFPFIYFYTTIKGPRGAGVARNLGAEMAKAPFLLFLDADDWLTPTALADMLRAQEENPEAIIYADYIGHAYIEDKMVLERLGGAKRLIDYNEKSKEATVLYHAFDFDCVKAQQQPIQGQDPYIWNVISSLVPATYHREIGGFDESMASWEDYDYWVRLAKAGKCFHHINKPLMEYRFYTGKRRSLANPYESGESGRQLSSSLLQYMHDKYEGIEIMPCSSCGGGRRKSSFPIPASLTVMSLNGGAMGNVSSSDMVEVELVDGNVGDHLIAFQGTSYNYRSHGDRFQMLAAHAKLDRRVRIVQSQPVMAAANRFTPPPNEPVVAIQTATGVSDSAEEAEALKARILGKNTFPADVTIVPDEYDLTELWGVDDNRAVQLKEMGVRSARGVSLITPEKIAAMFQIPPITARRIVSEAQKVVDSQESEKVKK